MAQPGEDAGETQVLIAAADIGAGNFVRSTYHLAFAPWPEANITDQMLTNKQVKATDFEGAVARRDIVKGGTDSEKLAGEIERRRLHVGGA